MHAEESISPQIFLQPHSAVVVRVQRNQILSQQHRLLSNVVATVRHVPV